MFYADSTNAPLAGWYYAVGVWFQWGLSNNNTEKPFPISFSSAFSAVSIGYSNNGATNGDGAPRVKVFTSEYLITNTGYGSESTQWQSFFVALGI